MDSSGVFEDQPGGCCSASEPEAAADSLLCVEDSESSTTDMKVLRCNLADVAAAEHWIQRHSAQTNTCWIVKDTKTKCTR